MSTVKVHIWHLDNGFTTISVDNRYVGKVEDPEHEILYLLRKLIKELQVDNIEVIVGKKV